MKKAVILTRDTAYFDQLRLCGGEGPVPPFACVSAFPPEKAPQTVWLADGSTSGCVKAENLPECDAVFTDRWEEPRDGVRTVCKYREGAAVLREIREICGGTTAGVHGGGGSRILLCTSADGGSGTSAVALGAALAAAPDAFYLNLEPVSGYSPFPAGDGPDFGAVLFRMHSRFSGEGEAVLSMAATDRRGVSYFLPPRNAADMGGLSGETVDGLLSCLKKSGKFARIVVDCPFSFGTVCSAAAAAADEIFLICREGSRKNGAVRDWLQKSCGAAVSEIRRAGSAAADGGFTIPEYRGVSEEECIVRTADVLRGHPLLQKNEFL